MYKWISFAVAVVTIAVAVLQPMKPKTVVGTEGYWRIVNDNGVYWFLSPDGQREFLNTVQSVQPHQFSREKDSIQYRSNDYKGDLDAWAKVTADRVRSYGFKSLGAWCNPALQPYINYTRDLNLSKWSKLPIDHPMWEHDIEDAVVKQVVSLKNDKKLVGYYTDNEMDWKSNEKNAEKYFEVTSRLLKKYDPNHLNLGVRFHMRPALSVLRASKGRVDAHSVNVYSDTPQAYKNMVREFHEVANVPVIVTEFSYFSTENLSGNKNENWPAGGRVASRKQRAEFYAQFVEGMAGTSFMIGADWFQWNDEPPAGRGDGEDLACGIVSVYDDPYPEMVDATRLLASRVNSIHAVSDSSQNSGSWKDDPKR